MSALINYMLDSGEEIRLMLRLVRKDAQALAIVYQTYSQQVFDYLMSVLHDNEAAKELTQDVFTILWESPLSWSASKGRLCNWLLSIARNRAVDYLRRQARPAAPLARAAAPPSTAETDDQLTVQSMLARLPNDLRRVVYCAYYLDMNIDEIARALALPPVQTRRRLQDGVLMLRKLWLTAEN